MDPGGRHPLHLGAPSSAAPGARGQEAGASREDVGHREVALELATGRVAPASDAEISRLRLKLAGLHFIVAEG